MTSSTLAERTQHKRRNIVLSGLAALVIVAIGFAYISSRAGAPFVMFDVASGTVAGNATLIADATSPGGKVLQFGAVPPAPDPNPTPTPPPGVELMGWQLNPSTTGLLATNTSCGSLPKYTGSSKPAAGTIIKGQRIETSLDLSNGNITIEKSCIKPTSIGQALVTTTDFNACGNSCPAGKGQVIIRDSEFDASLMSASTVAKACAFLGVGILERNYMHGMGSGICFYNTGNTYTATAINNYVHKLRAYGDGATTGSHNEAFTVRDYPTSTNPNRTLIIRSNRFDSSTGNDTGALFIQAYGGFINNVIVENNLLEGGGYQLILEKHENGYGNNMQSINNRFTGTGYGPGYVSGGPGWSVWRDNYRYDPSKTDAKGAIVQKL